MDFVSYRSPNYKAACKKSGCTADYFPDKWGEMEASRKGWFFHRNGDAWCPQHIPDWVAEWRKKRGKSDGNQEGKA